VREPSEPCERLERRLPPVPVGDQEAGRVHEGGAPAGGRCRGDGPARRDLRGEVWGAAPLRHGPGGDRVGAGTIQRSAAVVNYAFMTKTYVRFAPSSIRSTV
jgi:hypothetical protein